MVQERCEIAKFAGRSIKEIFDRDEPLHLVIVRHRRVLQQCRQRLLFRGRGYIQLSALIQSLSVAVGNSTPIKRA